MASKRRGMSASDANKRDRKFLERWTITKLGREVGRQRDIVEAHSQRKTGWERWNRTTGEIKPIDPIKVKPLRSPVISQAFREWSAEQYKVSRRDSK